MGEQASGVSQRWVDCGDLDRGPINFDYFWLFIETSLLISKRVIHGRGSGVDKR